MKKSGLVSIITPCFNANATIALTIESVLAQTYTDWEMIIVDDCSTDDSPRIIKSYMEKDDRIKYIRTSEATGSPSIPRNIGMDYAAGEYVAFLDADDIWLKDKLKSQLDYANRYNVNFLYSYYEKMTWDGKRNNRIVRTKKISSYQDLLKTCHIPLLTTILKRDIIGDIKFKQIPQEDYNFWLDILKQGHKAYNICEVTSIYRESGNSRSANKFHMFKGHWNVIRNHQKIHLPAAVYYMFTFSLYGFLKYIK